MTRWMLVLIGLLGAGGFTLNAQTPPPTVNIAEPLEPGKTVAAEITAGTRHVYQLPAAADYFLELTLANPGLKCSFRLLSPAGKRLQAFEDFSGAGPGRDFTIAALTREAQSYQVEVYAFRNQAVQRYELKLKTWRFPVGNDALVGALGEKLYEALTAYREARYAEARDAYNQLLKLQLQVYGPNDLRNAFVLTQRAGAEKALGELSQAAQSLEGALRIYDRLPFDGRIIGTLQGLGEVFSERGEYTLAVRQFERAYALSVQRAQEEAKAGQNVSHMASMFKVAGATLNIERCELMVEAAGSRAFGWSGEGFAPDELAVTRGWLRSKGNSIEGGTTEVNLNVVAKRVLGLRDTQ